MSREQSRAVTRHTDSDTDVSARSAETRGLRQRREGCVSCLLCNSCYSNRMYSTYIVPGGEAVVVWYLSKEHLSVEHFAAPSVTRAAL